MRATHRPPACTLTASDASPFDDSHGRSRPPQQRERAVAVACQHLSAQSLASWPDGRWQWGGAQRIPCGAGYSGGLLRAAAELADRLMPAFDTPTGIPLSWVNLRRVRAAHLPAPSLRAAQPTPPPPPPPPPGGRVAADAVHVRTSEERCSETGTITGRPRMHRGGGKALG